MDNIIHLATISDLYKHMGFPMLEHTSFAMVKIEEVRASIKQIPTAFSYGFYGVGFKKNLTGYMKYGRQSFDFDKGVLAFTSPNQVLSFDNLISKDASGWYLFFHKEMLSGHTLWNTLYNYHFFDYATNEALHLSEREEQEIENIFERLFREYELPTDTLSKQLIASSLDVLFTYSERYYKRQFITRSEIDSSFVLRFERELTNAFKEETALKNAIPTVGYLATKMNVSPNYLSDLLRALTGQSTIAHIHKKLIEKSKTMLVSSDKRISEIAYDLGFEYPQYFSSFFKSKTGQSPSQYRNGPGDDLT